MGTWYENKTLLNTFILIMVIAFMTCMLQRSTHIGQWGLGIFIGVGTLIIIRGVARITMRMCKSGIADKK